MKDKANLIALAGLGYWGRNLLRNLLELEVLHMACDSNLAVVAQRKKEFPGVNYTVSFAEILRNPQIKAVVIATPAATHYDLVKKALIYDKDVFIEKPLALTVKEGEQIAVLAKKRKKIVMVGHILQYHPAVIKLKELVLSGELGKIHYIYSNRLNIGRLRIEENILWSFAPHDISAILMLLEENPVKVSAFGGDYLIRGINDVTLTVLEFKNGVKAHVFVSWLHPYKEQKLIVVGSKAMAVFNDIAEDKLLVYPHTIEWRGGNVPVVKKADFRIVSVDRREPLRLEMEHFIDCIQVRKIPKTDVFEGLRVLKILEAAEKSLFFKKEALFN